MKSAIQKILHALKIHLAIGNGAPRLPTTSKIVAQSFAPFFSIANLLCEHRKIDSVIQIGANDGSTVDNVKSLLGKFPDLAGCLVEPIPELAARLRDTFQNRENITILENVVTTTSGPSTLWVPHSNEFGNLEFSFVASLDKAHVNRHSQKHGVNIKPLSVWGLTLEDLVVKSGLRTLDCLVIDAEGIDDMILLQLNYIIRPNLIQFEHIHLSAQRLERVFQHLSNLNYVFNMGEYDCICLLINLVELVERGPSRKSGDMERIG